MAEPASGYARFSVLHGERVVGEVEWSTLGRHNAENALAALVAARHAGVDEQAALEALRRFGGVRRRLEVRGTVDGVVVYDDFAHHPTAIATTLEGVRRKAGAGRVIAVLEPRSNTMKLGTHKAALAESLRGADQRVRLPVAGSEAGTWPTPCGRSGRWPPCTTDLAQLTAALVGRGPAR